MIIIKISYITGGFHFSWFFIKNVFFYNFHVITISQINMPFGIIPQHLLSLLLLLSFCFYQLFLLFLHRAKNKLVCSITLLCFYCALQIHIFVVNGFDNVYTKACTYHRYLTRTSICVIKTLL
jgi:hypothetical protein